MKMKKQYYRLIGLIILINILVFVGIKYSGGSLFGSGESTGKDADTTVTFVQGKYFEYLENIESSRKKNAPDELYRRASAHTKVANFEQAEDVYAKSYAYDKNPLTEKVMKSLTMYNRQDYIGTEKLLSGVKSSNPQEMSVINLLKGVAAFEQKKYDQALKLLLISEKQDPASPAVLYYLGASYSKKKNRKLAATYLERAESAGLETYDVYVSLGRALNVTKKYDRSKQYYEEALALNKKEADVWFAYALLLEKLKMHEEAVGALEEATDIDASNIAYHRKKVANYLAIGKEAEAVKVYNDYLPYLDEAGSIEVWIEQIGLYHRINNTPKKLELIEKVKANIPAEPAIYALFAKKLLQVGDFDLANAYIEEALVKAPKNKNLINLKKQGKLYELFDLLRDQAYTSAVVGVLLERYASDGSVAYALAVREMEENDDYAGALRYVQQKNPSVTEDDMRMLHAWYRLQEGNTSIDNILSPIEINDTNEKGILWLKRHGHYVSSDTDGQTEYAADLQALDATIASVDIGGYESYFVGYDKYLGILYRE